MKKYLKFIVAGLIFSLAACGGNDKPKPSQPSIPVGPSVSTPEPSVSTPSVSVENISETMARIDEIIKGYIPGTVDANIELPTSIEGYNIYITWKSDNPNVISSLGKYAKPMDDVTVTLTASYEYKGINNHKVVIQTTVLGYSDDEKLAMAEGEMSQPVIDATHTSFALIENIESVGAAITWVVSGSEYATINEGTFVLAEDAFLYGAEFSLTATIDLNGKTKEVVYNYTIDIDYNLRLAKVKEAIEKPQLVDNKNITVPLTGEYDTVITWSANDEEVVINDGLITVPAKAEDWTLLITGTLTNGGINDTLTFDYQVTADDEAIVLKLMEEIEALPTWGNATLADKPAIDAVKAKLENLSEAQIEIYEGKELSGELTEKVNSLLEKYIEVRGVELTEEKATWEEIEVATGYEITFTDLGKTFTVLTNEFVYADYGIPTDTKYNVQINVITGEVEGYITMGEAITQFGTPSDLPKVATPVISFAQAAFTWTANQYEGATAVRVYVDGVLLREVPISDGQYLYGSNGVTSTTSKEDWNDPTQIGAVEKEFVIQFVGNGTTHQSSEFIKVSNAVAGNGSVLNTPTLSIVDNQLSWTHAAYNQGYEFRIDDFRVYYTPYKTKMETATHSYTLDTEELGLPEGTHSVKVRTMSDTGGTPSGYSNEIIVNVVKGAIAGPTNINYNNDEVRVSWDAVENAKYYKLSIPETGFEVKVNETSFDLGLAQLGNGTYTINIDAYIVEKSSVNTILMNYTSVSSLEFEVVLSENKLAVPANISGDYNGITWDAVEGAVGYEVVINGETYNTTSNSFVFINNGFTMNFDYNVKVRALGAVVADHSFFSGLIEVKYELTNVALLTNGTIVETYNESTQDIYRIIDGKDNTQWQATPAGNAKPYMDDMSFIITLDNVYTVYGFRLYWQNAKALKYDIEYSVNGIDWFTATEFRLDSGTSGNRDDYLYLDTPIQAQFIRFQGIERFNQYGYNLYAFEVYSMM